ncbi:MAG: sigma-70 family RNA polymerase sigma factor [Chloroflexi bacterium]|nr:sigma-70 family RNA polymerase sigma factor [Chloroflexota bacterium]
MYLLKKVAASQKRQAFPEANDEQLIIEIANGAVWAMETLYERYHRMLYAFAYHIVSDRQVAEDLLQEVFVSIWRNAASYSPTSGAARSWLISIVRHRAIDYLRSLQHREIPNRVPLDEIEQSEQIVSPDVWGAVWQSAQRSLIRDALKGIPQEQRLVIELAYFQGWTQKEIAEACQLPLGTVKARIRLGLLHLKRFLAHKGVHES